MNLEGVEENQDPITLNIVRREGLRAKEKGQSINNNPYREGTIQFKTWLEGYEGKTENK